MPLTIKEKNKIRKSKKDKTIIHSNEIEKIINNEIKDLLLFIAKNYNKEDNNEYTLFKFKRFLFLENLKEELKINQELMPLSDPRNNLIHLERVIDAHCWKMNLNDEIVFDWNLQKDMINEFYKKHGKNRIDVLEKSVSNYNIKDPKLREEYKNWKKYFLNSINENYKKNQAQNISENPDIEVAKETLELKYFYENQPSTSSQVNSHDAMNEYLELNQLQLEDAETAEEATEMQ